MKRTPIQRIRSAQESREERALDSLEEEMPKVAEMVNDFPRDAQYELAGNLLSALDTPEEQLNILTLNIKALDTVSDIGKKLRTHVNQQQGQSDIGDANQAKVDDIESALEREGVSPEDLDLVDSSKNSLALLMAKEGAENFEGDVSPELIERSYVLLERFGVLDDFRADGMSEQDVYKLAEGYAKFAAMKAENIQDMKDQMHYGKDSHVNTALDDLVEVQEYTLADLGIDEDVADLEGISLQSGSVAMSGDAGAARGGDSKVQLDEQPSRVISAPGATM